MLGTIQQRVTPNYRKILTMSKSQNGSPSGSDYLPSQQPKAKDEFERGYDKGVSVTCAVIIDLIDSDFTMDAIRGKLILMKASAQ